MMRDNKLYNILYQIFFLIFLILNSLGFARTNVSDKTIKIAIVDFLYARNQNRKLEQRIFIPTIDRNLNLCNTFNFVFEKFPVDSGEIREFRYYESIEKTSLKTIDYDMVIWGYVTPLEKFGDYNLQLLLFLNPQKYKKCMFYYEIEVRDTHVTSWNQEKSDLSETSIALPSSILCYLLIHMLTKGNNDNPAILEEIKQCLRKKMPGMNKVPMEQIFGWYPNQVCPSYELYGYIEFHSKNGATQIIALPASLYQIIDEHIINNVAYNWPIKKSKDDFLTTTIKLIPNEFNYSGHVTSKKNSIGQCTEPWLFTMPEGSIILGANPASCNPSDWFGGSASKDIFLPNIYSPTLWVLKVSWPDKEGKGVHSPKPNQSAVITFDNQILWSKSTLYQSTFNDYYAVEHDPVITTIVVSKSSKHTLTFEVPENTAWDLSEIELTPYPYPEKIRGIGYSPFRDCQMPGSKAEPTIEQVKEDLFRLSHTCNAIRTYGATGINGKIPAIAKSFGLKVYAGAWIDGDENDPDDDEKEIQALINIANNVDVDGLIIGNEYFLRHQTPGSYATQQYTIPDSLHYLPSSLHYLQQRVVHVKNGIKNKQIPITTAEIDGFMFKWDGNTPMMSKNYKPIIDELDFLMVHTYPFWNSMPIEGAAEFTIKHYLAMQDLIEKTYSGENKRVIIGETGWPSAGKPHGQAIPSPENQKRYLREFLLLAEQFGVEYLYFDAFDELWKIEEPGHVGQNWGYSYTDRTAKYNFYGVLFPQEQFLRNSSMETYAPYKKYQVENRNVFPVYTEWPSEPISFLLTDQSINRLHDMNIDNDAIRRLDSVKNQKYASQKKFIHSLETIIEKDHARRYKNDILKLAIHNNHFIPSGWMGDTTAIQLSECNRSNPHNGEMATKIRCSFSRSDSWSGVYWLANGSWEGPGINIYEIVGSYPIILTFWARGMKGGEVVKFKVGGVGSGDDSIKFSSETNWIPLNREWTQYTINLTNQDLSNIVGGFCFVTSGEKNPGRDEISILIDDINFESE